MNKFNSYNKIGMRKWDEKNFPQTSYNKDYGEIEKIDDKVINVVIGCNIKTDVIDQSFKIVDNDDNSIIIGHFENLSITSWEVVSARIMVNAKGEIPYTFLFRNPIESEIGGERINKIMNGLNIQGCND